VLVTWSHPSMTVEFPGSLKPVTTVASPSLLTTVGPDQEDTPALVRGASIIRRVSAPASLLRLVGMHSLILG
jgi:hypothetical protein